MTVVVKGKEYEWSFYTYQDPKFMDEWLEDEVEIYEVVNTIPSWVADFGLVKPWCLLQDLFNFKFMDWFKK